MSDNVTLLHPPRTNFSCPKCGSEWFNLAVVLDAQTLTVNGHALRVECRECETVTDLFESAIR